MAQIIRPGHPVLFGGAPATFHMKAASSPMAAIEALRLNCAYVAIAKSLGLPSQAYMALSDGKVLDAQAGGETFSSALLAALAGVNAVAGPGMLDFVLTFSLPKLVIDNEFCGQALHFVRDTGELEDLPTAELVADLMREDHLITSPHTLKYWPQELYMTDPVLDRMNRDSWAEAGSRELNDRACEQVELRLSNYQPFDTDPAIDAEMRKLVTDGLESQEKLPELPPLAAPPKAATSRRRKNRRRRRS
jgi:trimethylamine--corrinoid protein Co-methyltransferase